MMRRKAHKTWQWYEVLIIAGLICVIACCIFYCTQYLCATNQARAEFVSLARQMDVVQEEQLNKTDPFAALQKQNTDCVGWIKIEETQIDYPVMYTPQQPQYYLRRNFEKVYSVTGTPFLEEQCNPCESTNLIIHGHNMKDGSMFAGLQGYLEKEYGLEHFAIDFQMAEKTKQYELMAVLHFELTEENIAEYYRIPTTEKEFETYVQCLEQQSLYCGGDSAVWGDRLLSLSTCDNKTQNGRIMVIAKNRP